MPAHPHLSTYSHLLGNHHQVGGVVPGRREIREISRESPIRVVPTSMMKINSSCRTHVVGLISPSRSAPNGDCAKAIHMQAGGSRSASSVPQDRRR